MRLRLWIVTDALQPPARGNGTTVARWIDGLRSRGHELAILEPGHTARSSWAPDVVLGYHAERCGPAAVELAAHCGAASTIALGGTDLLALEDGSSRAGQRAIRGCDLVVGAFPSFGERLAALELGSPAYAVVRRGVFRDPDPPLPRDPHRLEIALPSGLRRVKDPLFAIARFAALRAAGIDARLRIVGASLEEDLARAVIEAARALGLRPYRVFRHIIAPQAFRTILPPLGNDLVSMIKDSALVSALGVQDITQIGKVYSSGTFKFFETYNVVAFLYLVMTIALTLVMRVVERRMPQAGR